jgi:hypothetical protein
MQSITLKKPQNASVMNKWLQQAGIAGFSFFLIKGLLWIILAVWAVY